MTQPTLTIKRGSRLKNVYCEEMQILIESDRMLDVRLSPAELPRVVAELLNEIDATIEECTFFHCDFATTAMAAMDVAAQAIEDARENRMGIFAKRSAYFINLLPDAPRN
jgi:hypothetical protein